MHDASHSKIFGSVIVVSDRMVLNGQLQEALAASQAHPRRRGLTFSAKLRHPGPICP